MLSPTLQNQIKELAIKNYGYEMCGLIVDNNNEIIFYPCKNISSNPKEHFELAPLGYIGAAKIGKICAIVHSQADNFSSELDIFNSKVHNIKSYIYSWGNDEFFECGQSKLDKYIGLDFEIRKQDCFTLMRQYYKGELNIDINDYPRTDEWYKKDASVISANFEKEGFIEIPKDEKKKNDVILFDMLGNGHPHHMAIYLGKNIMLHHPLRKKSLVEYINIGYNKKISMVARHKSLIKKI